MVGKKDKHLAAAQKLLERGQLEKALAELAKVVEEDPKDTRVWLKMAELQAKRGANEEAATIYLKTGDLYIEQGFAQKAVAVYKNVVKLTPAAVEAYLKLGSLYKQLGLMNDSAQQYEAAATLYQRLGKLKEAISAFRLVVEVLPESLAAHIKFAELAAQGGLADEAGREFGKAADLLKAAGRHDEYLRVIERLLHHQPENFARSREAAEMYLARSNGRAALPKLQACLKVDPRDPTTLSMMAQAYEQLENKPKAVSVLKDLVRLWQEIGRTAERDAALKRALALDPSEPELHEMAGLYRLRGGTSASGPVRGPTTGTGLSGFLRAGDPKSGPQGAFGAPSSTTGVGIPKPITGVNAASSASGPARDAARLYAETEVFAKYGLLDRAEQHARRLLAAFPQHAEGRALLARILEEAGRGAEAAPLQSGVTGELALSAPRQEEADDGVPLPLDGPAAPVRPLRLSAEPLSDDDADAEPLDLEDAEELNADDLEEMLDEEDPGETPPPVDVSGGFALADLPEQTQAVVPLGRAVRAGEDVSSTDDVSGRFDTEPSAAARRSLDAIDLPPADLALEDPSGLELGPTPPPLSLDTGARRALPGRADETAGTMPRARLGTGSGSSSSPLGAVPVNPETGRTLASYGRGAGAGSGPIGSPITPPPRREPVRPLVPLTPAELDQHADLGIAYKEMGLFEQAIAEFAMLESEPSRAVFALTMTAECLEAAGRLSEAAALYKRALNTEGVTPAETVVLYYGLGRAFEGLGDVSEARYFYEKVVRRDPRFRDVAARLQAVQASPEKQAR